MPVSMTATLMPSPCTLAEPLHALGAATKGTAFVKLGRMTRTGWTPTTPGNRRSDASCALGTLAANPLYAF
jgi:hypothetical protein